MIFRLTFFLLLASFMLSCDGKVEVDNRRFNNGAKPIGADDPICRAIGLTKAELSLTNHEVRSARIVESNAAAALKDKLADGIIAVPKLIHTIPSTSGVSLTDGNDVSLTFKFEFKGVPFCQHQVLAFRLGDDLFHYGDIPNIPAFDKNTQLPKWPDINEAASVFLKRLKTEPAYMDYQLTDMEYESKKCLGYDAKGKLEPYWELNEIKVGQLPNVMRAITDESKFYVDGYGEVIDRGSFSVEGVGNVIKRTLSPDSSVSFEITKVRFDDIGAGSFLCNSRFVPDNAIKINDSFQYQSDSQGFGLYQVTIFHNANIHSDWFSQLPESKGWPGPQIRITVDEKFDGENNTAVYLPNGAGEGFPQIQLGDGDGSALTNLLIDPEVISHELGHHIVYQNLKDTRGESLVLHEGLADFFVFARTKNPCLGESICPISSAVCESSQCLRTADNSYTLDGPDLPLDPHKTSQLISGLLWDVGAGIGLVTTAGIVYHAINYLKSDSGYTEFLVALMVSDRDINQGKNACFIKEVALLRGFTNNIGRIDCNQFVSP